MQARNRALQYLMILVLFLSPAALGQTGLTFSKNYFVTGDYVVGGWQKQSSNGVMTTGFIAIPDVTTNITAKKGKQPPQAGVPNTIPAGANIVAAFLYWETVESSQTTHAGQQGLFNNFPITGTVLGNPNAPTSWSSGGCAGNNQGSKTIVVYRADVRPYLNLVSTPGGEYPPGNGTYIVQLADSGGSPTPITLGATLVIVYSVTSPSVPLNAIVFYDGVYAPNNSSSQVSQLIQGFYQAANTTVPIAKITHIVGNGQPNKFESVALSGISLPSLYPGLPPFPGTYNGDWDNPTWLVNSYGAAVKGNDPSETATVMPNSSNAGCVSWGAIVMSTTVQDTDNDGLLDIWEDAGGYTDFSSGMKVPLPGASSTTKDLFVEVDYLESRDAAGTVLHSHLPKQEALDKVGMAFQNAPVDCDVNGMNCKGIHVHFDVGDVYQQPMAATLTTKPPSAPCDPTNPTGPQCDPFIISYDHNPDVNYDPNAFPGGNAIPESETVCPSSGPTLCAYPDIPTVGWKGGLLFVRNNATDPNTSAPLGNFEPGREHSYHYILSGHALGMPRSFWSTFGTVNSTAQVPKLISIAVTSNVGTVTIESLPHMLTPLRTYPDGSKFDNTDPAFGDPNLDRVTITGALVQTALNGTYSVLSASTPLPPSNNLYTSTFTIATSGVPDGTYTFAGDSQHPGEPHLAVGYGGPTASSGHSDLPGADSAITFGLWPADDASGCNHNPAAGPPYCDNNVGNVQSQAGTVMHELGHTLGLTHGGLYFDSSSPTPYVPVMLGSNCKPNFLSIMSYSFQVRGFIGTPDPNFPDTYKVDYSTQLLSALNEGSLSESAGIGPALYYTRWYGPGNASSGDPATRHCDGSPIGSDKPLVRIDNTNSPSPGGPIDWNNNNTINAGNIAAQDINFNGSINSAPPLQPFYDWKPKGSTDLGGTLFSIGMDLRQIGGRRAANGSSGGIDGIAGGIDGIAGGIDGIAGGIDGIAGGIDGIAGGIDGIAGGIDGIAGGIDGIAGGIDGIAGGVDVDFPTANSTVDAPTKLVGTWQPAPLKDVLLQWTPPGFGQIRAYYVWRLTGGPVPNPLATATLLTPNGVTGATPDTPPAPTYTDTTVKTNMMYTYYVVAQIKQGNPPQKSGVSNFSTVTTK